MSYRRDTPRRERTYTRLMRLIRKQNQHLDEDATRRVQQLHQAYIEYAATY